jgi:hypothetical protein
MDYVVSWTIDVEADSPREAAEMARACQTRQGTTAVVFEVREVVSRRAQVYKPAVSVDLMDAP